MTTLVGRGGNARFHTFRLVFTDGRTNGRTKALIELRVRNEKDKEEAEARKKIKKEKDFKVRMS